ncbi:MAG: HAMP domain-containing sensor histidine kinase [Terracoccus sp.]
MTRLVLSHLLVALVGASVTFLVVRQLAPAIFDESLRLGAQMGGRQGQMDPATTGDLRAQVGDAVNRALLVGALVGLVVATAFGVIASRRLLRPIGAIRAAARRLATGRYDAVVPVPVERELAELAGDVNTLAGALATTETRRTRLMAEVAHEMRTPLTVVHANLEGMIDGVVPTSAEQLGSVEAEVSRLGRLVDDLSALSRVSEGAASLELQTVDLAVVLRSAASRLEPQADDAGLTLGVEPREEVASTDDPLLVRADPDRLAQVVTNLVGNAIRATPEGGSVTVRLRREGLQAVAEVADTGVGIDEADLERVFERFVRLGDPTSVPGAGRARGSGIGLTIARALVEAQGGTLEATSAGSGRGATFTMRLPLQR